MVGIFLFYPKDTDSKSQWPKTVKEFLDAEEITVVNNRQFHYLNYIDNGKMEKMEDLELINLLKDKGYKIEGNFKKTKTGYANEDKTIYVRIIRQSNNWFKSILGYN